jgi:hypothetical protein
VLSRCSQGLGAVWLTATSAAGGRVSSAAAGKMMRAAGPPAVVVARSSHCGSCGGSARRVLTLNCQTCPRGLSPRRAQISRFLRPSSCTPCPGFGFLLDGTEKVGSLDISVSAGHGTARERLVPVNGACLNEDITNVL